MTSTTLDKITRGEKPVSPAQKFSGFLDKLKPQMALALPRHMNADRMSRLALTAFSTNPALQECSMQSIAASIMVAAQLGLEPGVNGHGYLIPYKNTCTFVPGWKGLVDLVSRSGRATVWTGAVFDGDAFEYQLGDAPYCRHTPSDSADDESGKFTHVYAIGRVKDAQMPVIEVWSRAKVERHLAQYNKVGGRHYAKASENNFQMYGRKVALLQVLKYMPSSIELSTAVDLSNAADTGEPMVIDMPTATAGADPETGEIATPARTYAQIADAIKNATSAETAALELDAARGELAPEQFEELCAVYRAKWPE